MISAFIHILHPYGFDIYVYQPFLKALLPMPNLEYEPLKRYR